MKKLYGILLLVGFSISVSAQVIAPNPMAKKEATVEAEGVGINKAEAVKDALRNSVSQAMGTYVRAESKMENFVLVSDVVATKAEGYVTRYDVLSEEEAPEGKKVKVSATVSLDPVKADGEILADMIGGLRFLVLYDPRKASNKDEKVLMDYATERTNENLSKSNYRYIEKERFDELRQEALKIFKTTDTSEASYVQKLGMLADAQFLIYIKDIDIRKMKNPMGILQQKATVQIKAYDNCTAEGLGTVVLEGDWATIPDEKAGMQLAVNQAIEKNLDKLLGVFNKYMNGWIQKGAPYEIRFYSAGTYRDFRSLKTKLKSDPDFGGQLEPVSTNNYTKFNLTFKKKPEDMADKILDLCDEVPVLKAKVMDIKLLYGRQISLAPQKVVIAPVKEKNLVEAKVGKE